jgi:hypothetical protein
MPTKAVHMTYMMVLRNWKLTHDFIIFAENNRKHLPEL